MGGTDFIYKMITDKVIEKLNEGTVPWRQPWRVDTLPRSYAGRPYRGINLFLLMNSGYESPYWITWNAAKKAGGRIKESENKNYTVVIYWNLLKVKDKKEPDKSKNIPLLRYFRVWNYQQTENLPEPKGGAFPNRRAERELTPDERHHNAHSIVEGYLDRPQITHGRNYAAYRPTLDVLEMPSPWAFDSLDEYYSTLFHEFGHSTAHSSRLNRDCGDYTFGSHDYGKEELVAEMTATFLNSHAEIVSTFDNSAAYINGWIKNIRENPKILVQAAAQAQKAADYILGVEWEEADEDTT